MIISAASFSLMQVMVKYLSHIPVPELVFFRSIISLILSLAVVYRLGIHPLGIGRKYLIMRGVFGVLALSLFFYTLQNLPIATAITIQYLSPIFTSLFAIWILREPMKWVQWLFFGISFLGIVAMKGLDNDLDIQFVLAGVVSAVFSGLAYNMIRKVKNTDHPVVVVLYFPLVATPIMGVASIFTWVTPEPMDWVFILLMGIFTQIAQVFMTKAWQAEEANKIASLKYVGIVFALFFDFTLFGISPQWSAIIGIVLVLSGVILNIRYRKKFG
jgi:drug/metabolite transporter (DMT)-like permease